MQLREKVYPSLAGKLGVHGKEHRMVIVTVALGLPTRYVDKQLRMSGFQRMSPFCDSIRKH